MSNEEMIERIKWLEMKMQHQEKTMNRVLDALHYIARWRILPPHELYKILEGK